MHTQRAFSVKHTGSYDNSSKQSVCNGALFLCALFAMDTDVKKKGGGGIKECCCTLYSPTAYEHGFSS